MSFRNRNIHSVHVEARIYGKEPLGRKRTGSNPEREFDGMSTGNSKEVMR
jgi:hypothetical protein